MSFCSEAKLSVSTLSYHWCSSVFERKTFWLQLFFKVTAYLICRYFEKSEDISLNYKI